MRTYITAVRWFGASIGSRLAFRAAGPRHWLASRESYNHSVSKLRCDCGEVLSISGPIPNPIEFKLLSDTQLDSFDETVDTHRIYMESTIGLKCQWCGRLGIFLSGVENRASCYKPELQTD
jgi:hypothetical protein